MAATVEITGIPGIGKSTNLLAITDHLNQHGIPTILVEEKPWEIDKGQPGTMRRELFNFFITLNSLTQLRHIPHAALMLLDRGIYNVIPFIETEKHYLKDEATRVQFDARNPYLYRLLHRMAQHYGISNVVVITPTEAALPEYFQNTRTRSEQYLHYLTEAFRRLPSLITHLSSSSSVSLPHPFIDTVCRNLTGIPDISPFPVTTSRLEVNGHGDNYCPRLEQAIEALV